MSRVEVLSALKRTLAGGVGGGSGGTTLAAAVAADATAAVSSGGNHHEEAQNTTTDPPLSIFSRPLQKSVLSGAECAFFSSHEKNDARMPKNDARMPAAIEVVSNETKNENTAKINNKTKTPKIAICLDGPLLGESCAAFAAYRRGVLESRGFFLVVVNGAAWSSWREERRVAWLEERLAGVM
jgi:hypothetical protein